MTDSDASQAAISQLLGAFLHEINNPLGVILLYADLLEQDEIDSAQRQRLTRILEAGRRCQSLVQTLGEITESDMPPPAWHNLVELVEVALAVYRRRLAARSVQVEVSMPPRPEAVWARRGEALLAVLHLIGHAEREVAEGGRITISAQASKPASVASRPDLTSAWVRLVVNYDVSPSRMALPDRATGPPASDPGLTAADDIARRYGGRLFTGPAPAGGASLVFELPRSGGEDTSVEPDDTARE